MLPEPAGFVDRRVCNAGALQDKAKLKKLAKSKGLAITQSSTWEWFKTELKDEAVFKEISEEHCKEHFESLVSKAKEVEEDADKASRRRQPHFAPASISTVALAHSPVPF